MTLRRDKATNQHCIDVAPYLSKEDVDEVYVASGGRSPYECLLLSVAMSEVSYTIFQDGEPVIMYGVAEKMGRIGQVWMLTTPGIEKSPKRLVRNMSWLIDWLHIETKCIWLTNFTDLRNKRHHMLCRFLGFEFSQDTYPTGPDGLPFYRITRTFKPSCAE